jgi:hypothetical protein
MAKKKGTKKSKLVEMPPVVIELRNHAGAIENLKSEVADEKIGDKIQALANRATKLADALERGHANAVKKAGLEKKKVLRAAERKARLEKRMAALQAKLDSLAD